MPILNYTTSVEAIKTVGQIQGILVAHGARSIFLNYDDGGYLKSLSFIVPTPEGDLPVRLPVDVDAVQKIMTRQGIPRRLQNKPQAVRVAWRITKDWVEAQMAILEAHMVKMEQIFLPYIIVKDNKTLFQSFEEQRGFFLTQGESPQSQQ